MILPLVLNGTRVSEEREDEPISYWPSVVAERFIDWQPVLCAYITCVAQITFAAFCLRFDYEKAILNSGLSANSALDASAETNSSSEILRVEAIPVIRDFPRTYYNTSIAFWAMTHVIFLAYLAIMGKQISTATYTFMSNLITQPVMLIAVVVCAISKNDFFTMWRYDETADIGKDHRITNYGSFRMDLPLMFLPDAASVDRGIVTEQKEDDLIQF